MLKGKEGGGSGEVVTVEVSQATSSTTSLPPIKATGYALHFQSRICWRVEVNCAH